MSEHSLPSRAADVPASRKDDQEKIKTNRLAQKNRRKYFLQKFTPEIRKALLKMPLQIFMMTVCLMIPSIFGNYSFAGSVPEVEKKSAPSSPQRLYDQSRALTKNHELLKAQEILQKILDDDPDFENIEAVQKDLQALNLGIILSDVPIPQTIIYKVRPRDTLIKLARKFHTTVEVIQKRNHLDSDMIRNGQKLSIYNSPFNILIDKSDNILMLKNGERILKVYPVATGKETTTTPIGEFTIKDRLVDPVWFHHGSVVPPGTPKNFLGTRWLGFNLPKYGIHGTVQPELIGKSVSGGCVRMRNSDVEELYTLIPEGTKVIIKE